MSPKYKIDRAPKYSLFKYALYELRSFFGLWDYWKEIKRSDYISFLEEEYESRVKLPIYLPDINDDPVNFVIIENIDHIYIVSEDNKERVERYLEQSVYSTAMSLCDFVLTRNKTRDNKIYYQMIKNRKNGDTYITFKNMSEVEKFVKEYYDKEILK